mmetsp:Transcript_22755/g.47826  ORF Transcript_22755/g.47826 Transcript_22755/m.47826 type:complete len:339 (+) Transcript_22755:138-1154(+)
MEARKLQEAESAMAAGAKCEKTGMFSRWKPDWEGAAAEYEKAATSFRVAKAPDRAVEAFIKASNAHTKMDAGTFMAAKHLESAAFILRDQKNASKSSDLYEGAAQLHQEEGRIDQAAEALVKAARVVEEQDGQRAATQMLRACSLLEDEEDERILRVGVDTFKQATASLIRASRLHDAASVLQKQAKVHELLQQPHGVARCELSCAVVFLAADAFDSAQTRYDWALQHSGGFAASEEAEAVERLLHAYTSQDEGALQACVSGNIYTHLENRVTHLARGLTLRSAGVPIDKLTVAAAGGGGECGDGGGGAAAAISGSAQGTGDFGEVAPEDELDDDDLT